MCVCGQHAECCDTAGIHFQAVYQFTTLYKRVNTALLTKKKTKSFRYKGTMTGFGVIARDIRKGNLKKVSFKLHDPP